MSVIIVQFEPTCLTFRALRKISVAIALWAALKSDTYKCSHRLSVIHSQEIENPDDPVIYVVQLKGKTHIINLMIRDGEMTVLKKYTRSE